MAIDLAKKRERDRVYRRAYAVKNRDKLREKDRRWREANRDKCREKVRRYRLRNRHVTHLAALRHRAAAKGIEVTITREWVAARLAAGRCELTGLPFSDGQFGGRCGPFSASVDRIDSNVGYTPENCRMILWGLNMALSEWGEPVYEQIATAYLAARGRQSGD